MNPSLMMATYASRGADPLDSLNRTARQDQAVNDQLFAPQYQKALSFATDPSRMEAEATAAEDQAQRANAITRGEFLRAMSRSGSSMDPRVSAENDRLMTLNQIRNTAGAGNNARLATYNTQTGLQSDLTDLGLEQAKLAQGLRSGAAQTYQTRTNLNTEATALQKQAEAAALNANIGMGLNAALSLGSLGLGAGLMGTVAGGVMKGAMGGKTG